MPSHRAREPNVLLATLPDPAWVECPRCARPARVVRKPHRYWSAADATVTCGHCSFRHEDAEVFRNVHGHRVLLAHPHPRCGRCGGSKFDFSDAAVDRHGSKVEVRARCRGCGAANAFAARGGSMPIRDGHDHWFGLPLVLKTGFGRWVVWAYNPEHIDLMEAWLKADLRERSLHPYYATMAARLPAWMKAAHARPKMLHALAKLRQIAKREGIS